MSDRNLILREPGHVIVDAAGTPATFFSEAPIEVELMEEVVALPSARFGKLDDIPVGRLVKITFVPQAVSAGAIAKLFTLASKARGASLLASTDKTLDIHTTSGKRGRVPSAFLYQEPEIRGTVRKTPFGACEWWGILPIGSSANALTAFWNETSVSYPGDSLLDTAEVITPAWTATWGASPFDSLDLDDNGFTVRSKPKLLEDKVDGKGIINVSIADYEVSVEFTPMNITRAAVMARAGFGTALGGRKSASASEFIATGTGIYVAVRGASLRPGKTFAFGAEPRVINNKLTLQSSRIISGGTETAQLYVGTEAPA